MRILNTSTRRVTLNFRNGAIYDIEPGAWIERPDSEADYLDDNAATLALFSGGQLTLQATGGGAWAGAALPALPDNDPAPAIVPVAYDNQTGALVRGADAVRSAVAASTRLTVGILGDSFCQQNVFPLRAADTGYNRNYMGKGFAIWLSILTHGALNFNEKGAWGKSGQTTAGIVSQIGQSGTDLAGFLAYAPELALLQIGTNDLTGGISVADTIANIQKIIATVLAGGTKRVILHTIAPRSNGLTSAQKEQARAVNQSLKAWNHPQVAVSDVTPYWTDYANLNGDPVGGTPSNNQSAYTIDGIHPGSQGAYYMAMADIAAYKAKWGPLPAPIWYGVDPLDTYSATNVGGNRLVNGQFVTTGGTASGGVTGTVAGSWTANRSAGDVACAASLSTLTLPSGESVPCQTLTFASGGTTATTVALSQTMTSGNRPAIGSVVRVSAYIKISGLSKLAECRLRGADVGAVDVVFCARGLSADTSGVYYPSSYEGLHTFDFTVASASVNNQIDVRVQIDAGTSGGTVQVAIADYRVIA